MTLFTADSLDAGYSGAIILRNFSLDLEEGEVVTVIGPNGAGKSTLMKAVFGLIHVERGSLELEGRNIKGLKPSDLVRMGMSYVPQEKNVFPSLTVKENLEMGAYVEPSVKDEALERVFGLFPGLRKKRNLNAGSLSGGERQMAAIGRALMLMPKMLLLDEPTAGLAPLVREEIFIKIREVADAGVGVLMVEQNAKEALYMSDRGYVMVMGKNRLSGTGPELLADPEVASLYLGGDAESGY